MVKLWREHCQCQATWFYFIRIFYRVPLLWDYLCGRGSAWIFRLSLPLICLFQALLKSIHLVVCQLGNLHLFLHLLPLNQWTWRRDHFSIEPYEALCMLCLSKACPILEQSAISIVARCLSWLRSQRDRSRTDPHSLYRFRNLGKIRSGAWWGYQVVICSVALAGLGRVTWRPERGSIIWLSPKNNLWRKLNNIYLIKEIFFSSVVWVKIWIQGR